MMPLASTGRVVATHGVGVGTSAAGSLSLGGAGRPASLAHCCCTARAKDSLGVSGALPADVLGGGRDVRGPRSELLPGTAAQVTATAAAATSGSATSCARLLTIPRYTGTATPHSADGGSAASASVDRRLRGRCGCFLLVARQLPNRL